MSGRDDRRGYDYDRERGRRESQRERSPHGYSSGRGSYREDRGHSERSGAYRRDQGDTDRRNPRGGYGGRGGYGARVEYEDRGGSTTTGTIGGSSRNVTSKSSSSEGLPELPRSATVPEGTGRPYPGVPLTQAHGKVGRPSKVFVNHFSIESLPIIKVNHYLNSLITD